MLNTRQTAMINHMVALLLKNEIREIVYVVDHDVYIDVVIALLFSSKMSRRLHWYRRSDCGFVFKESTLIVRGI